MTVSGRTLVFGILGDPVAHSLSPVMQNAAFAALGVDAVYVPFPVAPAALGEAVAGLRALGVAGVNVTIPHKEAVRAHLDRLDPLAARIGAVNTVVREGNLLVGYNTDGAGFLRSLAEDLQFYPTGKRVLLLGAGGACRAALVALVEAGASQVVIANRTVERAAGLCGEFASFYPGTRFANLPLRRGDLEAALSETDLLVNTSSLGLKGESIELPWEALPPAASVYDMVYARTPEGTPLLREARSLGRRAADGLGMLAGQGEEAFFLWTGLRPPPGLMKKRLLAETSS